MKAKVYIMPALLMPVEGGAPSETGTVLLTP